MSTLSLLLTRHTSQFHPLALNTALRGGGVSELLELFPNRELDADVFPNSDPDSDVPVGGLPKPEPPKMSMTLPCFNSDAVVNPPAPILLSEDGPENSNPIICTTFIVF